jgi:hypothetical protein
MSLEYYYVLSLSNNAFFMQLYSENSQKTEQEVRNALGINYSDFKPDYSAGCGNFPYAYDDGFATWNYNY